MYGSFSPLGLIQCSNPCEELDQVKVAVTPLPHLGAPSLHVPAPGGGLGATPPSLEFHLILALWPGLYRHLLALEETARTRRGVESNGEDRMLKLGVWVGLGRSS